MWYVVLGITLNNEILIPSVIRELETSYMHIRPEPTYISVLHIHI